jgi:hypothetical protein
MAVHDQLNSRWEFTTIPEFLWAMPPQYSIVDSGEVKCMVTQAMRLTCGKLLKQSDWTDWQESDYPSIEPILRPGHVWYTTHTKQQGHNLLLSLDIQHLGD